jgi:NAD(P)H dehydrogenase (quinone)
MQSESIVTDWRNLMSSSKPNILIINGHPARPTPGHQRLAHSVANAYAEGARAQGACVRIINLTELSFDPILHAGYEGEQPLEPDLRMSQRAIEACDHLVIVTPMWWGTDPALLRGFVDRTMERGWAFRYSEKGIPQGLLAGRTARVIRTMDSPGWWYRLILRRPADAPLERATLRFCGFRRVKSTKLYSIHGKSREQIGKDLARVAKIAGRDALRTPKPKLLPAQTPEAIQV